MAAHFRALDLTQDTGLPRPAPTNQTFRHALQEWIGRRTADRVGGKATIQPAAQMPFSPDPQATIPGGQEREDEGRWQFQFVRWRPLGESNSVEAGQSGQVADPQVAIASLGDGVGRPPKCPSCVLQAVCPYWDNFLLGSSAQTELAARSGRNESQTARKRVTVLPRGPHITRFSPRPRYAKHSSRRPVGFYRSGGDTSGAGLSEGRWSPRASDRWRRACPRGS